jgi:outer membrane protein
MKQTKPLLVTTIWLLAAGMAWAGERLTLEQSRRLALENNVGIKNSRMETEAARQVKKAAFTKYFPTLSAGGASFKADQSLMDFTIAGGNLPVYDGNPANLVNPTQFAYFPSSTMSMFGKGTFGMLNLVQPLFTGGRIINGNRLAALGVEAGGYKEQLARHDVIRSSEEQYWRVVALDQKLKTVSSYEGFLDRLLGKIDTAYQAGLASKNDLLKVKLKLSELKLNHSKLRSGREVALMALCQYIGAPYDAQLELDAAPPPDGDPAGVKVDHQAALQVRPEFKLLEAAVKAECLQSSLKLGEYLPQIGVGLAGLYMQSDFGQPKTTGLIYGTLSIPLSAWWEAGHLLNERKAREQIAQNNLKDRAAGLLIQMEKAWHDLVDAESLVRLAREAVAQALENLKVNEDSYENGLSDLAELLEAQAMRQQALDQMTDAVVDSRIKRIEYMQVTGR